MADASDPVSKAMEKRLGVARKLADSPMPERQVQVLRNWIAVAEARGVVQRRDLQPSLFGRMLQFVGLVEVLESGEDYRHVIEGREVMRWFGEAGREPFSTLYAPDHLARLRRFYGTIQMTGRPNRATFATLSLLDEEMTFSQLVLPATDESGEVRFLAVVFDFPDQFRQIPTAPLRLYSPWRRLRKGKEQDTMRGDLKWR